MRLAWKYGFGINEVKDEVRAATLLRELCDEGVAAGCWWLGSKYASGKGVSPDATRARTLYEKAAMLYREACDGGEAKACAGLASAYERGRVCCGTRRRPPSSTGSMQRWL